MSSDDSDWTRRRASPEGPRRSKRLARSANESPRGKNFCKAQGRTLRESVLRKFPKQSKRRTNEPGKRRELSSLYNGESLTSVELHQLYRKFAKDGHFRPNAFVYSPSPILVSKTTNTTMDDSMSVTFTNPLPNATGSTLRIATSGSEYVCTNARSVRGPSTTGGTSAPDNCGNARKRPAALANLPHKNTLNITPNGIALNFANSPKHESLVRRSNVYDPFKRLNRPELSNRITNSIACDLNYPIDSRQFGYGFDMSNVEEPTDRSNPEINAYGQSRQARLNEAQITQGFQTGNTNSSDSAFASQNESLYENLNDIWNVGAAGQMESSNSLANDASILLCQPELKKFSENNTGHPPTSLAGYNLTINTFGNNRAAYEIPENDGIAANTNCNLHESSLTTWTDIGASHRHYTNEGGRSCDNFTFNGPFTNHSSGRCGQVLTLVNDDRHLTKSTNSWPQNNQARGHFSINSVQKHIAQTAIMPSLCTNVTGTKDANNLARVTNDADAITNNKENLSFGIADGRKDSQNSHYCPAGSSICSYDYRDLYENYISPRNPNNDLDHFVSTTT